MRYDIIEIAVIYVDMRTEDDSMAYSKSINIFLPTGNAEGPIELEMLNWNGMVIKIPRKEVSTYADVELDKPGIYFLFCKDDDGNDAVYVGEAENLLKRLKQHIQDYNAGKESYFWQVAVCVKGNDLNKALIKYLENFYCNKIRLSSKYTLLTKKSSPQMTLKRAELASMEEFVDNVNMLMGTIGYKVFEDTTEQSKDRTYFYCKSKNGTDAKAYYTDSGFVVVSGSRVATSTSSKTYAESVYKKLYDTLLEQKVIVDGVFVKEYTFASPTAAADVVLQSYVSGNEYWLDAEGKKLKEYNI